ncbi:MAG: hypothetical protein AAFP98_11170 [Pseudomonadota bacterium]
MKSIVLAATFVLTVTAAGAQGSGPLSAIDWLSQSVQVPDVPPVPHRTLRDEPPIASTATPPRVRTSPLDGASPDPIGLLASSVTALPTNLWSGSDQELLIALLQAEDIDGWPAMQDLLQTLLLAEADPPLGASSDGKLFQARVDKLLDLGAIEPARGLLEQAQIETPNLFRRWFDIALLLGTENQACQVMQRRIDVAPTDAARIFCLARSGDWNAAALSLNTHVALGDVTDREAAILSRFLDPELFEGEPPLGLPARVSPLMFRIYEAIGERISTTSLPRAFAHADLQHTVGWKSQLEAAERLTRHGAVQPNVVFALYTSRTPSASGGIWDRAAAIQAFERALDRNDAEQVAATLNPAWEAAKAAKIELAFAAEYTDRLLAFRPEGSAAEVAFQIALLSPNYEEAALARPDEEVALVSLAQGVPQLGLRRDTTYRAVALGFTSAEPPARLMSLAQNDKLGEAILRAIALFNIGADGDLKALTDALAFFRAIGLEDVARRASLQVLLLDRAP